MKQFPGNLEGDAGLAGASGHGEQDTVLVGGNGFECLVNGVVLVIACLPCPALGFEGDCGEAVAPFVFFGEGRRPEFIRAGVVADIAFVAGLHVDAIEADPIGGVGKAGVEISGVFLGLADALGVWQAAPLGFEDGQLVAAIGEHVVGDVLIASFASSLEATEGDDFASHTAVCDDAPACVFEGGVDQLGAGFRLRSCHGLLQGAY